MSELKEFIASGIIEMYCLNQVTEKERLQVEEFSRKHPELRNEIESVSKALLLYAQASSHEPLSSLKSKILNDIIREDNGNDAPLYLHSSSTVEEWMHYLSLNNILPEKYAGDLVVIDLPRNSNLVTYVAAGVKGIYVEEIHPEEEERLFILKGTCKMTINGVDSYHKAGDFILIPQNALHRAEVTSHERMIAIGQRQAA